MKPSMKTGVYNVYLLFESDQGLASVITATCKAVLHALCGITPTSFQLQPNISFSMGEEEMLPVTSYVNGKLQSDGRRVICPYQKLCV